MDSPGSVMPSSTDSGVWDYANPEHRRVFGELLSPLVASAGAFELRQWNDPGYARTQLRTWMLSLREVTKDVLAEAVDAMVTRGVTRMPRPGDVRAECAKVITAKRKKAFETMLVSECVSCRNTRWIDVVDPAGAVRMMRCSCWQTATKAMNAVGNRLALPPSEDEEASMSAERRLLAEESR